MKIIEGRPVIQGQEHPLTIYSESLIYVRAEQLEFTLVAYGCALLEQDATAAEDEIARVDDVLSELDRATGRNREQFQRLADQLVSVCLQESSGIGASGFGSIGG